MGDTRDGQGHGHGRKRGLPSVGAWAAMLTLWLPPAEAGAATPGAARPVAVLPGPAGPGCLAPSAPTGGLAAPGGSGTERPPTG